MSPFHPRHLLLSALLISTALPLASCVETAVGASAVAGTSGHAGSRHQRGGERYRRYPRHDQSQWLNKGYNMWMALNLRVYEARVLVSGTVPNEDQRLGRHLASPGRP